MNWANPLNGGCIGEKDICVVDCVAKKSVGKITHRGSGEEEQYLGSLSKYNQVILIPHIGSYTTRPTQNGDSGC